MTVWSSHQELDVWQIGNTLSCISAIKAALAVAFVSSWEASNHSQSHSPVLQNSLVIKGAGISVWDPELSNQAGPLMTGTKNGGHNKIKLINTKKAISSCELFVKEGEYDCSTVLNLWPSKHIFLAIALLFQVISTFVSEKLNSTLESRS